MFLRTRHITEYQRAFVFRRGDFRALLGPGTYRRVPLVDWLRRVRIDVVSTLEAKLEHPLLEVLVEHAEVRGALRVLDLAADQRALVWRSGRVEAVLGTGLHAYWKARAALVFEVFDLDGAKRFEHPRLEAVLRHPDAPAHFDVHGAPAGFETVVFVDGEAVARVTTGRFVRWKDGGSVEARAVELREQTTDVAGQEILTRDKVTLRVNLVVSWRVVDALRAVTVATDAAQALYREAQLALRAAVGTRTLDALLADKETVGMEVTAALAARAEAFGVAVASVGLRDLILPGDMKTILNQVIEAEKQAEANLIRRREETAAARSQANTARLLAANPTLARMRELELLQEVLAGAKATFVFAPSDIAGQIRGLVPDRDEV